MLVECRLKKDPRPFSSWFPPAIPGSTLAVFPQKPFQKSQIVSAVSEQGILFERVAYFFPFLSLRSSGTPLQGIRSRYIPQTFDEHRPLSRQFLLRKVSKPTAEIHPPECCCFLRLFDPLQEIRLAITLGNLPKQS